MNIQLFVPALRTHGGTPKWTRSTGASDDAAVSGADSSASVAVAPSAVGSCVVSAIEFSFGPVAWAVGFAVTVQSLPILWVTDGAR